MIGFRTSLMTTPENATPSTTPLFAFAHDLIRSPLVVPASVTSRTVMFRTATCSGVSPRLLILMPWPGPQLTPWIHTSDEPSTMEMQSSPVPILAFRTVTPLDCLMWMPSVLGLSPGADTTVLDRHVDTGAVQ
jgi:hypothetical protein